ncbi:MAG: SGNH/GDSL hydrolase family protein [Muribaculaceae bacterium]|nr:SGNH/GDSL hydrolase family protein [Muribaculaceae bacterium]
MKHLFVTLAVALTATAGSISAQKLPPLEFTSGHDLTLINKLIDTPRRYARVDTLKYDGFTDYQRRALVQQSAGLALAFETNSDCIYANIRYQKRGANYNGPDLSVSGLDLYIKDADGQWIYAGNNTPRKQQKPDETFKLVLDMDPGNKECLLYLPTYSIVDSVNIGVTPGCYVRPIENPFRHRIVFFGSSYTHGSSVSRAGMTYPLQFERATGLHTPVLGVSANSKLQQSFARVLADTPADAFVFAAFSHPTVDEIEQNFEPFLATVRSKHPTTPIIFMQTIRRERRNFDRATEARDQAKMDMAQKVVMKAMAKDPNVYFIVPSTGPGHEATCDGTHPSDLGYYFWMNSIKDPILRILDTYGIR